MLKLQTRLTETNERYDRTRDDYKDLQQRYRTLSQDYDRMRAEAQLQDSKHQSEWKIERLTKDNRALELANTELRKELQDVKQENLEAGAAPWHLLETGGTGRSLGVAGGGRKEHNATPMGITAMA